MAPSEVNNEQVSESSKPIAPEVTVKTNGTQVQTNGKHPNSQGHEKPKGGNLENARVTSSDTTVKVSGAELKKQNKLEKQARRAQEKQAKTQGVLPDLKGSKKSDAPQEPGRKGSTAGLPSTPITKSQHHKRTGSVSKAIAHRPMQPQASPAVGKPQKENKNVALFGHLYGQPRRTSIAMAGKDVHPAVLALGLQMSNYVICGSNARCVATLLASKRVISCSPSQIRPRLTTVIRLSSPMSHLLKIPCLGI